ncbi:MAG: glycine/sarcosine/betaine reductase selenoprotein B family protein [Pseudomonadota bacterium]
MTDRETETSDPVAYIQRTRAYYEALGFERAYEWAHFADVPFAPLRKPLAETTVAIVTTAAPYQPDAGPQGPGAPYNARAKFFSVYERPVAPSPDLRNAHVGIDRDNITVHDMQSYVPINALAALATRGVIGSLAPTLYGLPTNRSKRVTLDVNCPDLTERCVAANIDAAILVPNCPVCHQSTALAARALEAKGIATVIIGCARDIIEHVGVPRFLFNDFPLGSAAGPPNAPDVQRDIAARAVQLLERASAPRTTQTTPHIWPGKPDWKRDYFRIDHLSAADLAARRAAFDQAKQDTPPKPR